MRKVKILVVEDESIIAKDIQHTLKQLGYDVPLYVVSGEAAIEKATELRPDLVLMDIVLKGELDGIEAAAQIRARLDIPIVFLTAFADEKTLQRAKVSEPFGYVLKPFEERELFSNIEMALYKHQMDRRLRESKERYRALIAQMLNGFALHEIICDETGRPCDYRFLEVNAAFEETTGLKGADIVGKTVLQVLPQTEPYWIDIYGKVALDGNPVRFENYSRELDKHFEVLAYSPKEGQFATVFTDITERVRVEKTLRQYAAELEASNEELDAFAHTVAHDLKNPLAIIVGNAEALEKDHVLLLDEELQKHLRVIAQCGRKTSTIIDELLLLATARRMKVETRALEMASIVAEALERLTYMIAEYQAEILLPDVWPVALGYSPWVEEVWVNYLSNAIKYGGHPPRVELGSDTVFSNQSHPSSLPHPSMVRFWVRDNGDGLTPEEQAQLFTPFTQLHRVRTQGYGLGLSIVQRIVEQLGGQVGVESQVGRGSVFSFALPSAAS